MKEPSLAIVKSDFHSHHSGSWSSEWLKICSDLRLTHELVDWRKANAFERLRKHDIVLWHYSHYSDAEMKFAATILRALEDSGCIVFPGDSDSQHFDDKVAQAFFFDALHVPSPKNYVMFSRDAVTSWAKEVGEFPIVAKLRSGSGASNVVLLQNECELFKYADRMFGAGLSGKPSVLLKIKSNIASASSASELFARFKRAPEFFFSRKHASGRAPESGYVYLQQFVPGVNFDLKVVVVGDQLSFIGRKVRKGDFRASGGGDLFYDRSLVTKDLINMAFKSADLLGSDCTGFDVIYDPATSNPMVLETSYGFSHQALMQCGGYFDRQGAWHNTPMNAPAAVLSRLIKKFKSK